MKNTFILIAVTVFTAAQTIADLPTCSLRCLTTAISGLECSLDDFACSCKKASELTPVVTPCIQSACSSSVDQEKTLEVLSGICVAAGYPIETPAPSGATAAVEPTPAASSEAPPETLSSATEESEYPEYPKTSETTSEYPTSTQVTDDVPNLPSSCSDLVLLPSFVDTAIASPPSSQPISVPAFLPPYPTGTPAPSVPVPSGTGATSTRSSYFAVFTGGAAAVKAPMMAAGVFGVAAFVL